MKIVWCWGDRLLPVLQVLTDCRRQVRFYGIAFNRWGIGIMRVEELP